MFRKAQWLGERGTSYLELLVMLGVIGVIAAIAIPSLSNAASRNKVFAGSELVAAAVRSARLSAISRNTSYRIRFECPSAGSVRVLAVTGDTTIDDATDRCSTTLPEDGPSMFLANGVSYGTVPTIQVNSRGQMSVTSGTMPLTITVTYEGFIRTLAITAAGRIHSATSG